MAKFILANMGIDVTEDSFYTSAMATASFLKVQRPNGCSAYVIGGKGVITEFENADIEITSKIPDYAFNNLGEIEPEAILSRRNRVER